MKQAKTMHANAEQTQALLKFKEKYGKNWKQELLDKWLSGADANEPDGHLLRQVRNQLGPRWLGQVKL